MGQQTVPRAEVAEAADALELAQEGSHRLTVDAACVKSGVEEAKLKQRCAGHNGDVWSKFEVESRKHEDIDVDKVKSHLSFTEVLAGKLTLENCVGNNLADIGAGIAAAESEAPAQYLAETAKKEAEATLVAQRVACIEAWHREHLSKQVQAFQPNTRTEDLAPETASEVLKTQLESAGRSVYMQGKWVICRKCQTRRLKTNFSEWTSQTCKADKLRLPSRGTYSRKVPKPAPKEATGTNC